MIRWWLPHAWSEPTVVGSVCAGTKVRLKDFSPGFHDGLEKEEALAKAVEHAKSAHNLTTIQPEVAAKVQKAIRNK